MPDSANVTYETDLACGDTVGKPKVYQVGASVWCEHCHAYKRVLRVRDPQDGKVLEPPTRQVAPAVVQDTAYGYASAYGYCAQSIDFAISACNAAIGEARGPGNEWFTARLVAIREGLARGNRNASDALRRYDARIERIDLGNPSE